MIAGRRVARAVDRRTLLRSLAVAAALSFPAAACGRGSKEDLIERARDIEKRPELEAKLGRPDDIQKVGPVEVWTYKASNGDVAFLIVGDSVTLQASGSRPAGK